MAAKESVAPPPNQAPTARAKSASEPLQVSLHEAGRLLGYGHRTIRRLIERGELQTVGRGHLKRVLMSSVRAYQERNLC